MSKPENNLELSEIHRIMKDFSSAFTEVSYVDAIDKLQNKYSGLKIEWIGGAVPVQMDATFEGLRIYARYRGDAFSITMGRDNGPDSLPERDYYVCVEDALNQPWNGFLDSDEFYTLFDEAFTTLLEAYHNNK